MRSNCSAPGRLIAASHNPGKVGELAELLAGAGFTAVPAKELGLAEPEETADTFRGNAELKALAAARATGEPALADEILPVHAGKTRSDLRLVADST